MKLSWFGRLALALFASLALGLGMSACGGGTIAYLWVLGQQFNQIASFKVDDFTGNLTQTPHEPFANICVVRFEGTITFKADPIRNLKGSDGEDQVAVRVSSPRDGGNDPRPASSQASSRRHF